MPFNVLIDPAVPAFMGLATTHEGVGKAIDLLLEINALASRFACVRLVADKAFELTLFGSGCFPFYEPLATALTASGWSEVYDPPTVLAVVNSVIQRLVSVSSLIPVKDLIVGSMTLTPPDDHLSGFPQLKDALYELLAFYCVGVSVGAFEPAKSAAAVSSAFPSSSVVGMACDVAMIDPPIGVLPQESFECAAQTQRLERLANFYPLICAQNYWDTAEDNADLELAIAARACQLRAASGLSGIEFVDDFRVGANFAASLSTAQACKAAPFSSATLETCARICGGLPQPDDNPFYTAPASGVQRQRTADGALAHRVHVSKHGPGLRLMYWRTPAGAIELSNIAVKDDVEIFE